MTLCVWMLKPCVTLPSSGKGDAEVLDKVDRTKTFKIYTNQG